MRKSQIVFQVFNGQPPGSYFNLYPQTSNKLREVFQCGQCHLVEWAVVTHLNPFHLVLMSKVKQVRKAHPGWIAQIGYPKSPGKGIGAQSKFQYLLLFSNKYPVEKPIIFSHSFHKFELY